MDEKPILVTGASGYVGGRLIARLLDMGLPVRAMGRTLASLRSRAWSADPRVELVQGDVLDADALQRAASGCRAAYYLVHSMIAQKGIYAAADRQAAANMARAAEKADLEQVIYLSGLGELDHPKLSLHLASRHEVGRILQAGKVPVTVLRAAMVLGAGSASFEILRYLAERLPVMITPRWVHTPTQPIAISNVLDYLAGCLDLPAASGQTFDIGGPDILTYKDLINLYTDAAGLARRLVLPVPVLTPSLSALWIHLVTPVPHEIAMPLTQGLSVPTLCADHSIRKLIPIKLVSCRQAIRDALDQRLEKQAAPCRLNAADPIPPEWIRCGDPAYTGGTVLEMAYEVAVSAVADVLWPQISGIGGAHGYYFAHRLWRLRGLIDRLAGGPGLGNRQPGPKFSKVGDAFDFWRVQTFNPPRVLVLKSVMKAPGEALFMLSLHPDKQNRTRIRLTARFMPRGLAGLIYWYALYPVHHWIFKGMLRRMARQAGGCACSPEICESRQDRCQGLEKPGSHQTDRIDGGSFSKKEKMAR